MRRLLILIGLSGLLGACGGSVSASRSVGLSQALTAPPEILEFESTGARQDLMKELCRVSQLESSRAVGGPVLFPIVRDSSLLAAPGLEAKSDLFLSNDAGAAFQLSFDGLERWPEDRRDSLHGLSEREAVELVAPSLLRHWQVEATDAIRVDRAPGAPYAAAYIDGVLRINPAFLYLAASTVSP